jgi:hypothetical protein
MGVEIELPPGNDPYCFHIYSQIHHFVSPLYQKVANKPGYGQLYICDCAKATTKGLKKNQTTGDGRRNTMIGRDAATS